MSQGSASRLDTKVTVLRSAREGLIPAHRLGQKAIRFSLSVVLAAISGPSFDKLRMSGIRVVAPPRREGMSQKARDFFYGRGGAAQPRKKKPAVLATQQASE